MLDELVRATAIYKQTKTFILQQISLRELNICKMCMFELGFLSTCRIVHMKFKRTQIIGLNENLALFSHILSIQVFDKIQVPLEV